MSSPGKQALVVGSFVVLVMAVLAAALVIIGGIRWQRHVDRYLVVTEGGVEGIDIHSSVTMHGVAIGEVAGIELSDDLAEVEVTLAVAPSIPIPAGSQAYFERVGLTGERIIDLRGGELGAGRIAPGRAIPRAQTPLERLASDAEQLGGDVRELVEHLDATLTVVERRVEAVDPERVAAIVDAVDPEQVAAVLANAEDASRAATIAARRLGRVAHEASEALARAEDGLDGTFAEAGSAIAEAEAAIAQAEATIADVQTAARALTRLLAHTDGVVTSNRTDLRRTIRQLRNATRDAEALFEAVREQPSLLLRR